MQDEDPLARGYNFDRITIDTVREQSRRDSVTAMSEALDRSATKELSPSMEFSIILAGVKILGINNNTTLGSIELSEPHDSFSHSGDVEIESRILCIDSAAKPAEGSLISMSTGSLLATIMGIDPAQNSDKVFLLVATGQGQTTVTKENIAYGAVQKGDGQTEFFKLSPMDDVDEEELSITARGIIAMFEASGSEEIAEQLLVAVKLDPIEEQALINEFDKASKVLNEKADEATATHNRIVRANLDILGDKHPIIGLEDSPLARLLVKGSNPMRFASDRIRGLHDAGGGETDIPPETKD